MSKPINQNQPIPRFALLNLSAKLVFHARLPPDGFLTSPPDFKKIRHGNKDASPVPLRVDSPVWGVLLSFHDVGGGRAECLATDAPRTQKSNFPWFSHWRQILAFFLRIEEGNMKISRNTILITGGASGIGLALAESFLTAGNEIIICGRRKSKLDRVRSTHPEVHVLACDVSKEDSRRALHTNVVTGFPDINILINNAGIQRHIDLKKGEPGIQGEDEIEVNLKAYIHLVSLFIPRFLKKDSAIVDVSSGLGFVPIAAFPIYCATKAAVHSFTVSLRYQLRDTSIRVFEIIPPTVDTELDHGRRPPENRGIPPSVVADAFLKAFKEDNFELAVGQAENLRSGNFSENFNRMNRW